MKTKTKCPWCDQEYFVDSSLIGRVVKCGTCDKEFFAKNDATVSPLSNHYLFASKKQKTNTGSSNKSTRRTFFSSQDPVENALSEKNGTNKINQWIKDFFDFKIVVTPTLVRLSFLLDFIGGSFCALWYILENEDGLLVQFLLGMLAFLVVIPAGALMLHYLYELTIVPFSILDTLKEIRDKLDEKTKI